MYIILSSLSYTFGVQLQAVTKRQFYQKQSFDEVLSSISAVFRKELCDLYE